jgi:hypothetical protein
MLQFVLRKMHDVLEENIVLFSETDAEKVLAQLKKDIKNYKSIDFYHPRAAELLEQTSKLVSTYLRAMNALKGHTSALSTSPAQARVLQQLENILASLNGKEIKLERLREHIPKGMLDVKRALTITGPFSESEAENTNLLKRLEFIKNFLIQINSQYVAFIQQKTTLNELMWNTTAFYWEKLAEYKALVQHCSNELEHSTLTTSGMFVLECFNAALKQIPSTPTFEYTSARGRAKLLKEFGFYAKEAIACCRKLSKLGKTYFHLPHHNDKYHFDYDPTADLCATGGDCFGQCMTFIGSLMKGDFKLIRPPISLINFQLDQNRPWTVSEKAFIAGAETEVSAESSYDSLQWDDLKSVFSNEAGFLPGCICGLNFTMNDYTRAKRDFTAGHIAVVAKLDQRLSPYKYVVYEKELGAFGLDDEESLELVIKTILDLYLGMNYSKAKLIKYGEASAASYVLLRSIQNVSLTTPRVSEFAGAVFSAKESGEAGGPKVSAPSLGDETSPMLARTS